jgi:ectoine hydroxylase-related dioxygenase (phytanoyl-CoA dioxygenase family)
VVLPGSAIPGGSARLTEAYDRAVSTADPADVSIRSSTRVHDFVNRGPEFDGLYIYPPLLTACCRIIDGPFKLSTMLARTLEPGTPAQPLHVDVRRNADGWPLVGFIVMVDEFHADNGAMRFAPGSHLWPHEPDELKDEAGAAGDEVRACGPARSVIIFNGSVWHGHSANRSTRCRRSLQGAFIPREARAAIDQASRMRPETFERIGDLARFILNVGPYIAAKPS